MRSSRSRPVSLSSSYLTLEPIGISMTAVNSAGRCSPGVTSCPECMAGVPLRWLPDRRRERTDSFPAADLGNPPSPQYNNLHFIHHARNLQMAKKAPTPEPSSSATEARPKTNGKVDQVLRQPAELEYAQ